MKEGGKENEGSGSTESKSSVNTNDVGQDENDSESFPSASDSSGNTNTNNSTIHTVVQADLLDMILTDPIGVPRESRTTTRLGDHTRNTHCQHILWNRSNEGAFRLFTGHEGI